MGVLQDNLLDRPSIQRPRALVREHAQESVRFDRAVPVLEPVERVLGVAEVPVERPVAQLEQVLHRRALAAPAAPRARQAAAGSQSDKNGHLDEVLAISRMEISKCCAENVARPIVERPRVLGDTVACPVVETTRARCCGGQPPTFACAHTSTATVRP